MDTQQYLVETKTIKTEATKADEEPSLCNLEVKREAIDKDSGLEECFTFKTEFKSEDSEEILKCDYVRNESLNLFNIPENFSPMKYEMKTEEMDVTCPSVSAVRGLSTNYCESEKRWQKSNFMQQGKDISFGCFHCDFSTNFKTSLVRHMLVHNRNYKLFFCANCDYSTKYKQGLVQHMPVHNKGKEKAFACEMCSFKTHHKSSLKVHMKKIHSGNDEKHPCKCCGKCFRTKMSLDDHIIKNHQNFINLVSTKVHSCLTCDYRTTDVLLLKRHITVHAENSEKLPCPYCDKTFKIRMSLDDHIIKNHQSFKDLVSSKVHNCPTCDYKTAHMTLLKRHVIKVHSGNYEKHFCRGCEKDFKTRRSLDDHIIKNHQSLINLVSSKVYSCLTCYYKTTNKSDLKRHTIKVHSGNYEKHLCRGCDKHFKNKRSLDDHVIKKHQNFIDFVSDQIYCCSTCNYKTTVKGYLKSHTIKVHSENYEKLSCAHCEKHFKNKTSLDDHIIKNHPHLIGLVSSKIHSCTKCDYKTTNTHHLKCHMKKVHSLILY